MSLAITARSSHFDAVALNPQPLPPRYADVGWCGTVPKHFPPPPPPPEPWLKVIGQALNLHPLAAGGVPGGAVR